MSRILPALLLVAFTVYCIVDVAQSDARDRRSVPTWAWLLVVILLTPFGGAAWFVSSRSARRARAAGATAGEGPGRGPRPGGASGGPVRRGPVAPDDDPEFLWRLEQEQRRRRAAEPGAAAPQDAPRDEAPDADGGQGDEGTDGADGPGPGRTPQRPE
ncbi:PLD nuclease N-terminal domain-containing protein [Cellulomonas endophytica]|uniref:PLD nuclease N-terminal domain-containing protein n=1 Tax=Cellulomonas endophytica TaxID=2494735 RepID=UPI001F0BBB07|nr:PLD nuclease N-terminal domain-containing protein [Cellulomonas endophytica]